MPTSHPGRRRSRPVADAPALDGAELAKAWLVELVAVAPLERAARLPGPRFTEDAPRLCAAVVAALASDAALEDLEPGGTLAPLAAGSGHLAAAPGVLEAIGALEALRSVVWEATLEALHRPLPAQVADLSDRLAAIITTLTTATLESPHPLGPVRPGDRGPLAAVLRRDVGAEDDDTPAAVVDAAAEAIERARSASEEPDADDGRTAPAAEDDDFDDTWAPPAAEDDFDDTWTPPAAEDDPWRRPEDREPARGEGADAPIDLAGRRREPAEPRVEDHGPPPLDLTRRRSDQPDRRVPLRPVPSPHDRSRTTPADALAQIEATLRDAAQAADPLAEAAERLRALAQPDPFDAAASRLRDELPSFEEPRIRRMPVVEDAQDLAGARVTPWAASIERRLTRHQADGLPFAVLCLELADADRLLAADVDRDVVEALEQAEAAILTQLRPADALIRERPGRYWLTTPDTDAADARALGLRIASAVEELPPHRGAPLQAAVGVTSCPHDAADAAGLEALAEQALFAARAAGQRVAGPQR